MSGLFRRRLRNDHLKLLAANLQMARALSRSYQIGMALGLLDADAPNLGSAFKEALAAALAAATYLDRHNHLSPELAEQQVEIHAALKLHLHAYEEGRAAARAHPGIEATAAPAA